MHKGVATHHDFQDAVGGVLPGYQGHRPGAVNTSGEAAFGGVPTHLEAGVPPGQGTLRTLASRPTTAWQEVGEQYKHVSADRNDAFKESVSGVKVCATRSRAYPRGQHPYRGPYPLRLTPSRPRARWATRVTSLARRATSGRLTRAASRCRTTVTPRPPRAAPRRARRRRRRCAASTLCRRGTWRRRRARRISTAACSTACRSRRPSASTSTPGTRLSPRALALVSSTDRGPRRQRREAALVAARRRRRRRRCST